MNDDPGMKAFVMVGAPGAGKSTCVDKLVREIPGSVVICGDEIRAELYGNADIQGNYVEIHDRILEILENNVGKTVILDGTHYRSSYRKDAIAMLRSYGYEDITAVVVNRPLEVCLSQNSGRKRKVPHHVIERMHKSLQESLKSIEKENFETIVYA
jgi:predicted kinase